MVSSGTRVILNLNLLENVTENHDSFFTEFDGIHELAISLPWTKNHPSTPPLVSKVPAPRAFQKAVTNQWRTWFHVKSKVPPEHFCTDDTIVWCLYTPWRRRRYKGSRTCGTISSRGLCSESGRSPDGSSVRENARPLWKATAADRSGACWGWRPGQPGGRCGTRSWKRPCTESGPRPQRAEDIAPDLGSPGAAGNGGPSSSGLSVGTCSATSTTDTFLSNWALRRTHGHFILFRRLIFLQLSKGFSVRRNS